jgi:hypothetical protein
VARLMGMYVENFAKLRLMDIVIKRGVNMLTGKNGQGKTSAIDAVKVGIIGQKALPVKPLRKGAERYKIVTKTDEFTVTRTGGETGVPTLDLQMAKGHTRDDTPQKFLDRFKTALTFDPLAFIDMDAEEQLDMLHKLSGVTLDFKALDEADKQDYDARTNLNKNAKALQARLDAMQVLDGLPAEKLDDAAILARLDKAGEANRNAQEVFKAKQVLGGIAGVKRNSFEQNERFAETQTHKIAEMELQLKTAKDALEAAQAQSKVLGKDLTEAEHAYEAAPAGEPIDVTALMAELQSAQRTNRAIDQRTEYDKLRKELEAEQQSAQTLTRQMEAREEQKRNALAAAKLPVDGLVLEDRKILYRGMPLAALGTGERIRLSTRIGMAANPGLRLMCIDNGEALDDDGLKLMHELADEYDFDVLITKVDSSGKIGIVFEDGMVAARNEDEA